MCAQRRVECTRAVAGVMLLGLASRWLTRGGQQQTKLVARRRRQRREERTEGGSGSVVRRTPNTSRKICGSILLLNSVLIKVYRWGFDEWNALTTKRNALIYLTPPIRLLFSDK